MGAPRSGFLTHPWPQANAGWVDSGVDVAEGVPLSLAASGTAITANLDEYPAASSGPDGQGWNLGCGQYEGAPPPCALDGAPYGALVARIGADGDPFLVGSSLAFTPVASGDLYLAVNDNLDFYSDNAGYYVIVVQ